MLRHKKTIALAVLALVVVVLVLTGALPDLPDAETVIEDVATGLGPWTYVLVAVMSFLETGAFVGLVAPGETTVIVGGVIAGQGEISLAPLIGLVWLASVLGDTTSFFIGRRLGRGFLLRHGPKVKLDRERLEHVESYFERHGGKTILIGRFIGLVRAVSPFVAGSSGLPYRRFIPFSVIGCGLWSTLFCVLGYVFYRSFDRVAGIAGKATLGFGITVAVIAGAVYAWRKLRREENRRAVVSWVERLGRRRALRPLVSALTPLWARLIRPLVRLAAPRIHLVRDRFTPGRLGLELTSALAVSGVGLYVFVAYAEVLLDDTGPMPADRELLDLAGDLRTGTAVDVVKLVTDLGSFATTATLVLAASVLLLVRRHFTEVAALVVGAVLLYAAVQLAKAGVDRPRPSGGLVRADNASFPSAHAAYSTLWVATATALAWCIPGIGRRALLIGAAVAVAIVVGLSRVYLGVHYWSDVAGGWGVGAAILGACASTALAVVFIRQNGGEHAPAAKTS